MLCQGCSPNGKWPRAQTFRSELCDIQRINPEGSKLCPQGANGFFSLMPSSSDTLGPRDPKFGTRVHVSKGYPNMHNLGVKKLWGSKFWIFGFFLDFQIFLSFFIIRPKMLKMEFFENLTFDPPNFLTP